MSLRKVEQRFQAVPPAVSLFVALQFGYRWLRPALPLSIWASAYWPVSLMGAASHYFSTLALVVEVGPALSVVAPPSEYSREDQ
jgi:hypothetical protein